MSVIPNMKALEGAVFTCVEDRLSALLELGLGLAPTAANLAAFIEQCRHRAAGLDITESAYYDLLAGGGPSARSEWMALSPVLTVGETFLFRDKSLWKLIESTLLPNLAKLTKPVWLWSAGCSTGEEVYTLAIVARRSLSDGSYSILATDVNPKAIAAARVGVYTTWSMRGVEHKQLDGLIVSGTQMIRVHDDVKRTVRFETHNLLDDNAYPPGGMASFECIICRNVLIYMTPTARQRIIEKFAACLSPGGVLVLGHGEATGVPLAGLAVERHDAGVVYRKPLVVVAPVVAQPMTRKPVRETTRLLKDAARAAKPVLRLRSHPKTTEAQAPVVRAGSVERCRKLLAVAACQARAGQTESAERNAALATAENPLDPEPHVLLAALYAARDSFKQAESALRRALFLDPASIPALWQLGTLYRITDRDRLATHTFARLLARLEGLPPEQEALPFDNLTVNELDTLLRAALGEPLNA